MSPRPAVAVKGSVDGNCCHLRNSGKPPAEHQLPVGSLVATTAVTHKDERYGAIMLRRGPQDAWDDP